MKDAEEKGYKKVKDIPSKTSATAWHVQVNKKNYQIVSVPVPRLFEVTSVFEATKTGKILDSKKALFSLRGNRIQEAAEELVRFLDGKPTLEYFILPEISY